MPDDGSPIDARDDHIAGLLAVEPLDDITRRRLVTTAMRSTGTARRARALIAAAAIVSVVLAGAGVFVAVRGGNDTPQTASRDKAASLPEANSSELGAAADARDAGDFGELTVAANLQRLRAALVSRAGDGAQAPAAEGANKATSPATSRTDALLARLRALGCSTAGLPQGTIVALATGTYEGHDAIVVETETSGGTNVVHAVETGSCTVHRLS